ncbi:RadC-like JAB domain-containing protein [Syntrophus gentianae]|uniref:RadC-like JAB domain-containing protein n=1 Tax=Syntrophus gentianae TaxID=43775 RepID=A0A1H7XB48_9BACT|nr:JAB domain-containing protein [Syntrophus gentianae]SEM30844.1 RadC-like JAB domain-containing protein [Syntrophus gentianae]
MKFCRSLECVDIEKLVTIYLNVQNDVIGINAIPDTVNQATAYPREIFKNAFLFGASARINMGTLLTCKLHSTRCILWRSKLIR